MRQSLDFFSKIEMIETLQLIEMIETLQLVLTVDCGRKPWVAFVWIMVCHQIMPVPNFSIRLLLMLDLHALL